jgi:hypothetical protein
LLVVLGAQNDLCENEGRELVDSVEYSLEQHSVLSGRKWCQHPHPAREEGRMHFADSLACEASAYSTALPLVSPGGKGAAPPSGSRRPSSGAAHPSRDAEAPGGPGRSREAGAPWRSWRPRGSRVMLVLKKAERLPNKQRRPQAVRFESALSCLRFSREDWQNQRLRKGFHPQILVKTHGFGRVPEGR